MHTQYNKYTYDNNTIRQLQQYTRSTNNNYTEDNLKLATNRGSTVVKVLCYKSEGRWFDSSSNINEYQEYFLGVKAAGA